MCARRLQLAWKIEEWKKSMEADSRDGPPCIVKMTMQDITFWHVKQKH